ncbi:CBS domain-containing protein [Sinisalibacter aestuarii]|uniref:Inosine-5-monophosphate dehydrogenase n=1 Tax=Sinisalibacter aestuarii TaxID=2949426 RepID=A0ABQ5LSI6_9RHOB|nr:CBS domain-containing protein [Sinisalibacter aestuarii]GKY87960.1 inosine-5-monophosphate dehydrogenase [Sinisalibacter aestuarii]
MLISQILKDKPTQGVLTVVPGTTVGAAANILSDKRIGGLIVSQDGVHPLGIITERDIVRELGRRGSVCLEDKVDDMMTTALVTCGPGDRAIKVLQVMTEHRFRHMPVVDGDEMVGLVSIGDVVKARLDELGSQAEALKNMIMGY